MLDMILGGLGLLANVLGGEENRDQQQASNDANYQAQKEFAQMGLQWKSADAKAAGLHPMAAISGAGTSFSPSFSAGAPVDYSGVSDSLRSMLSDGQQTNRAQRAGMTDEQRELHALQVRRMELENSLLEGQNTQLWSSVMGQPSSPPMPGAPVAVQANAIRPMSQLVPGVIKAEPSKQESHAIGDRGRSAGDSPGFRRQHISNNIAVDLPSEELGEVLEGMGVAGHVLGPLLTAARSTDRMWNGYDKPSAKLPDGYEWEWQKLSQSWRPVPAYVERGMGRLSRRRREATFNARKGFR